MGAQTGAGGCPVHTTIGRVAVKLRNGGLQMLIWDFQFGPGYKACGRRDGFAITIMGDRG